jgi:hypothetical protein
MKFAFALYFLSTGLMAATIIPFERDLPRATKYIQASARNDDSNFFQNEYSKDTKDDEYWRGFSLMNSTESPIDRNFLFMSDDHARRDTYLWITDHNGSGRNSDLMESALVFLPRNNQMHVEEIGDNLLVTLTTGEEVLFNKKTRTIISGVLSELPVDLNPNRTERKYARISYSGSGLILRSDARGADPRLAATVQVLKGKLPACKIPGKLFWTQDGAKFKHASDEDVYAIINSNCGAKYLPGLNEE